MDKLLGLLSNLEAAIRYLLTGVVVIAVYLAALTDPAYTVEWAGNNAGMAFAVILSAGFLAFVVYRLLFWAIGDYVAWWVGASAPSLVKRKDVYYPEALAKFLMWRYSDQVKEPLGGYLTYRWAISHFAVASASSLMLALAYRNDGSLLDNHPCSFWGLALTCMAFGLFQCWFLFCVEREIYRPDAKRT